MLCCFPFHIYVDNVFLPILHLVGGDVSCTTTNKLVPCLTLEDIYYCCLGVVQDPQVLIPMVEIRLPWMIGYVVIWVGCAFSSISSSWYFLLILSWVIFIFLFCFVST